MPEPTRVYTDIDYESFPVADLSLDLHWIQLPKSVLAAREKAREEALRQAREEDRAAALPENHKVILVPAHPTYSPFEEELWPIINEAVQNCLAPHPALRAAVDRAVTLAVDQYRGWTNPFRPSLRRPPLFSSPRPQPA